MNSEALMDQIITDISYWYDITVTQIPFADINQRRKEFKNAILQRVSQLADSKDKEHVMSFYNLVINEFD